jgi:hypothetical protein
LAELERLSGRWMAASITPVLAKADRYQRQRRRNRVSCVPVIADFEK